MSPPWMPLYVADYLADTGHLGAAEHGAYLMLIMQYWQKGGLPDDDRQLARIARMTDRAWSATKPILQPLFLDGWKHARIERELAKASEKTGRRSASGKEGAKARIRNQQNRGNASSNASGNASSNAQASSSQPQSEDTSLRSVSAREPRKPKSVRTQISEDAQPTPADREHAERMGMAAEVFRFEWQRFRDHHLKVASTFASWPAAWRTWCANWLERGGGASHARAGPGVRPRGRTVAEMAQMDLGNFDDERADQRDEPPERPSGSDQGRSGFAGRLSVEDAAVARRGALVDH